ncbi:hypothetical protein M8A51_24340 [Schlegelella sp. S2-27]|uniref:Uncharacterized protein n=1 Tax=Caldimonas mangrovi TaxID=2944811 RepID=A0ABT0YV94_9BURK|nr:hypothetical protein [Caldimonas mangrovi]MCM5682673.1 hypothetical protein [Caldimonas mangrovi]
MKPPIAPTRTAALLSGLALGFAMPLQEAAANALALSPQGRSLLLLAALTGVFLVPVLLFVVGTEHLSLGTKDVATQPYWSSLRKVATRGLFWLAGAAAAFSVLSAFR